LNLIEEHKIISLGFKTMTSLKYIF